MPNDNNDELKNRMEKLEKEIEELKKELKENSEKDRKHHDELKDLQNKQMEQNNKNHKENLTWGKMGVITTPLMIAIVPMVLKYFDRKQDIKPQIKKDADSINEKMSEILKAIKESKEK